MFSYYVFALGILVGVAATLLVREISNAHEVYKDRKMAEFNAAVEAAAAHRKAQADRDWDAMLNSTQPSNVRKFVFDSSEDPFA
jgi:ABC-type lipoprotein release transport system permease subunit